MAGKGEQIDPESLHVNWDFADGLYSVCVEVDVMLGSDAAYFLDWLNRPELVIGVHDGNEDRFRADGLANVF